MLVDQFEPTNIVQLLRQSLPVVTFPHPLNARGYADYMWKMWDGMLEQAERKQANEIIRDMNGVEDQIRQQLQRHPEIVHWLIVEGIVEPAMRGLWTLKSKPYKGQSPEMVKYEPDRNHKAVPFVRYEGWLTGVERMGVRVRRTNDFSGTAMVLAGMYKSGQTASTTFQRHLKPQIPFHPNQQVMTLMGAYEAEIGPVLGEALVKEFGTVAKIIQLNPETIAEMIPRMGVPKARKLLQSFGVKV